MSFQFSRQPRVLVTVTQCCLSLSTISWFTDVCHSVSARPCVCVCVCCRPDVELIDKLFAAVDTDRDGAISKAEFEELVASGAMADIELEDLRAALEASEEEEEKEVDAAAEEEGKDASK